MVELRRPSMLLFLSAIALLPWIWMLPFPVVGEHAQWSDVLVAAAAVAWLVETQRRGRRLELRPPHVALAVYLLASAASLLVSPARHRGLLLLLGMGTLAALFVLTGELTADPAVRRAFVRVLTVTAFLLGGATLLGLALFAAGHRTRLIGSYGDLVESSRYARVQAGTYNPNLLASYCIFVSAGVAGAGDAVSSKVRRAAQVVLGVVVLSTLSRSIIGFFVAAGIRAVAAHAPRRRALAAGVVLAGAAAVVLLTVANLQVDPGHPGSASFTADPSPRRQAALSSAQTLADHPLLGQGLGSYPAHWDGRTGQAHLTGLEVAATQGPGALLALVGLVVLLWRGRRRPTDLATWSALAALAVDSLAVDLARFRHVWVLLGMADAGRQPAGERRPAGSVVVASPEA